MSPKLLSLCLALVVTPWVLWAGGGSSQGAGTQHALKTHGATYVEAFADKVNAYLYDQGVEVAIVARCGRPCDSLPPGFTFTHAGFAVFEEVRLPDGSTTHTYSIYQLYQGANGDPNRGYLAQDFMFEMVASSHEPELAVLVPSLELQREIRRLLRDPNAGALHRAEYNLLANPYTFSYDNCVTYLLRVVLGAIYGTSNRESVQQALQLYFRHAQEVRLGFLQRVGIEFAPGVTLDDQTGGKIRTVSITGLRDFLQEFGLLERYHVVHFAPSEVPPPAPSAPVKGA